MRFFFSFFLFFRSIHLLLIAAYYQRGSWGGGGAREAGMLPGQVKHTPIHSHTRHLGTILEFPIKLMCMFGGSWRKAAQGLGELGRSVQRGWNLDPSWPVRTNHRVYNGCASFTSGINPPLRNGCTLATLAKLASTRHAAQTRTRKTWTVSADVNKHHVH